MPMVPPLADEAALAALAQVDAGLDALATREPWRYGEHDLLAMLAAIEERTRRFEAARLAIVAEIDQRGTATDAGGARSTAEWLAVTAGRRPSSTRATVRLATALATDQAPATATALGTGAISLEQAQVVAGALAALSELPAETRVQAEATLLGHCERFHPEQLARVGRHLRAVLDPDGADELARHERLAARDRYLQWTIDRDGVMDGQFRLPAVDGALLAAVLDPLAKPRPTDESGRDPRSRGQRQADALVELARLAATADDAPTQGGEPVTLVVTLDQGVLVEGVGAALLPDGQPLSPGEARRLACDAQLVPAVLGASSQPLDLGRATRSIPAALRRALVLRDGGCIWPSCDVPVRRTNGHHVIAWADGGPTSLDNLVLLCARHHRYLHAHADWTITWDGAIPRINAPPWAAAA